MSWLFSRSSSACIAFSRRSSVSAANALAFETATKTAIDRRPESLRANEVIIFSPFRRRSEVAEGLGDAHCPAPAVEDVLMVVCRHDAVQCCLRRADDRDAPHQLIRPAIDEDAVDNQWNYLEGLRRAARGHGET